MTLWPKSYVRNKEFNEEIKDTVREVSRKDCSELLVRKCDFSQRSYNHLKKVLGSNNIKLVSYEVARDFANKLDIGEIEYNSHFNNIKCPLEQCMHASTDLVETLRLICATPVLFKEFSFVEIDSQKKLFNHLKAQNSQLYKTLDATKKTIFLWPGITSGQQQVSQQSRFPLVFSTFESLVENRNNLRSHGQIQWFKAFGYLWVGL